MNNSVMVPLEPPLIVPLDPSSCMCESLKAVAANTSHTSLFPNCTTNERCDGVRCTVDIFGRVFYIEDVILPCVNAVELVVEDENFNAIYTDIFNETGNRVITVLGINIHVYSLIEPGDYSMDFAVSSISGFHGEMFSRGIKLRGTGLDGDN